MRLDELLESLENIKVIKKAIENYEKETNEEIILEMEEFNGFHGFELRLNINYLGIEKRTIETWRFFNKMEYLENMRIIDGVRYQDIVTEIVGDIEEFKEIVKGDM